MTMIWPKTVYPACKKKQWVEKRGEGSERKRGVLKMVKGKKVKPKLKTISIFDGREDGPVS